MSSDTISRRDFVKRTAYGLYAAGAMGSVMAAGADSGVPKRPLGSTGVEVSILGVGGHHIGRIRDDQESIRLMRQAIDMGATFLDNAWEYHDGRSERLMGRALQDGYRDKAFLMTKHHGRSKKQDAMQHLEDSLRRLKTDVIDLWQFHEVVYEDDPDMIFQKGGAIEAADLAKKQGKVRFIGFTGHKDPAYHLKMLAYGYPWDAVQMPINVLDPHFKSFQKTVLPVLTRRNIGVIAMKTLAGGHVLRTNTVNTREGLRYAWSQPVSTIVSGMNSLQMLQENVRAARSFVPMTEQQQAILLARTQQAAQTGQFEPFKTTRNYDGPVGRRIHGIG